MYKIVTHSGNFHADDVFAVAALQLHLGVENVEVIRTRDVATIEAGDWVVDVGGVYDPARNRFDHHQNGAPQRENGMPYAAFGLVWKHVGAQVAGSREAADAIEQRLALPIDASDNGISLYTLTDAQIAPFASHDLIALYRPVWNSNEDIDGAFLEAVTLARTLLMRAIAHAEAHREMQLYAETAYQSTDDKRVVILDVPMPQEPFIDHEEVLFVVCPSDPNTSKNWQATAIRVNRDTFETRAPFPLEWAGLRDEELANISGIEDAVFCHKNQFLFVAGSKEGALAAVNRVLQ